MLAKYLKQLRQRSQLTSGQWATLSGISRTTLWRWEQSKALPRDEELKHALAALSASTDEQMQALKMLRQERVTAGVGATPPLTGTGLKRTELLKALRLRLGWTQHEAAERLGVNRVTLADWEEGDHWPHATLLHQLCQLYGASPDEVAALTTLSTPSPGDLPSTPDDVTWDDIETYSGDFTLLDLRYLTHRAQLAQMPHASAREREVACTLEYLHSLMLQPRSAELRRELRRLDSHPALLASSALFARHQRLYAVAQEKHPKGNRAAEKIIRSLLELGDAVPIEERCRAKGEWAYRCADRGDPEAVIRLSTAALADAEASDDAHLRAICQRQHTASLIDARQFSEAGKALERFPTHTPLFAVQQVFTYAMLLHKAGSLVEAVSAYTAAARSAQAAGMTGYANHFTRLAASVSVD